MTEQNAGGYQFDVSDDIAGNPAVKMVDDCHCSDVKPMGDQTNELVGGGNPYDFLIEPTTGKKLNIFTKDGRNLLKKMVKTFIDLNGGADNNEQQSQPLTGGAADLAAEAVAEKAATTEVESIGDIMEEYFDGGKYFVGGEEGEMNGGEPAPVEDVESVSGYFDDNMDNRLFDCEQPDWSTKCS